MHRNAVTNATIMLKNLNCVQCAPLEKVWSMALMEYSSNGKGIMAPMEFSPMVYSSNGKA